jgi:hypothetical protein
VPLHAVPCDAEPLADFGDLSAVSLPAQALRVGAR